MSLPTLKTPTFFITIPSTKSKIKFRPFLVKEEKIMMLMKESNNENEIAEATKDLIRACSFDKLDPDTIAYFDIEYILLKLRSKSVGNIVELSMRCVNEVEKETEDKEKELKPCNNIINFKIDLDKVELKIPEDHNRIIMIEDEIGITFKYPSFDIITAGDELDDIDLIVNLVENVFDKDNIYEAKDTPREELKEFIESIPAKKYEEIYTKYLNTMPRLEHTVKYKCSKCGYEGEYTFIGLKDFF